MVAQIFVPWLARHFFYYPAQHGIAVIAVADARSRFELEGPLLQLLVRNEIRDTRGMAQQVRDGDLVGIRKVHYVFRQRVIQFELSALDELQDGHRSERLGDGGKADDCARRVVNPVGNVGHAIGFHENHLAIPYHGNGRAGRLASGDRAEKLVDRFLRGGRGGGAQ
jgi:hypothetical protein